MDVSEFRTKKFVSAMLVEGLRNPSFVILDTGRVAESKYGKQLVVRVQVVETQDIIEWGMNGTSVENFADQYGNDSKAWVGKTGAWIIKEMGGNTTVIGRPIVQRSFPSDTGDIAIKEKVQFEDSFEGVKKDVN